MLDIANRDVLARYLLDRGIGSQADPPAINYCGGGVSGTVALVDAGGKLMIVKQALAQLKVKETWLCDPNRMHIEYRSNEIYHQLVPHNAPAVYFYDAENYIFGREAAPEHYRMWKTDLMGGLLDFQVAQKAIATLAAVHQGCAGDGAVAGEFASKDIFHDLRISPYIQFTVQKHPRLAAFAAPIVEELMDSAITLIHGDYSPKNILVDNQDIFVLDFEVACYGHPSFDLAFFSNHFLLKAVKNKQWAPAYLNMLDNMIRHYFQRITFMDAGELETSFVRLLALLMVARVDGKSPVEYLTEEADKELVRQLAFDMIRQDARTCRDVCALAGKHIVKE